MHVMQIVGVSADSASDVPGMLDYHFEGSNHWWDYYHVGGRWEGFFTELTGDPSLAQFEGGNILSWNDHNEHARDVLHAVARERDLAFLDFRDQVTGAPVRHLENPDDPDDTGLRYLMGEAVCGDAATAKRMTASRETTARDWAAITTATSLRDVTSAIGTGYHGGFYAMAKMLELVEQDWGSESLFYFAGYGNADIDYFIECADNARRDGDSEPYFLAIVDFHF